MAFEYERLKAETRLSRVQGRLDNLEAQHYEKRLDLIVARNEEQTNKVADDLAKLETDINELREEEDALTAQITPPEPPQAASSKSSSKKE